MVVEKKLWPAGDVGMQDLILDRTDDGNEVNRIPNYKKGKAI